MNPYDEILGELTWYYEYHLSNTVFWKNWSKREGCLDSSNPVHGISAKQSRDHYALAIREYRAKLSKVRKLKKFLEKEIQSVTMSPSLQQATMHYIEGITMSDKDNPSDSPLSYKSLITSEKYVDLIKRLRVATKVSASGIVNLVTNYECPCLVDTILQESFPRKDLYNNTIGIDLPFLAYPFNAIDTLIFGSEKEGADSHDNNTGVPKREDDGFVNNKKVLQGVAQDRTLVMRNLDQCPEFYDLTKRELTPRALALFNLFRNPSVKMGCRILLVSNTLIKFPFHIRSIELPKVDRDDARIIVDSVIELYQTGGYEVVLDEILHEHSFLQTKLIGLPTYIVAADVLLKAFSSLKVEKDSDGKKRMMGHLLSNALQKCVDDYINKRD